MTGCLKPLPLPLVGQKEPFLSEVACLGTPVRKITETDVGEGEGSVFSLCDSCSDEHVCTGVSVTALEPFGCVPRSGSWAIRWLYFWIFEEPLH